MKLHYFVVTEWTGTVPDHTIEHGAKHADLVWIAASDHKELPQSCDRQALEQMLK
ncbi:MAG: hypothetical protein ACI8Y7_000770 [Candidatus Woesearchaeota archaeon]